MGGWQMLRVDVVIPTIGRPTLARSVRSVNEQSVEARAIVVLDRPELLQEVTSSLAGLKYDLLVTSGAVGGAVARNEGFQLGKSEWVAFLDDDDWWDITYLESRLNVLLTTPNATAVFGAFMHVSDKG